MGVNYRLPQLGNLSHCLEIWALNGIQSKVKFTRPLSVRVFFESSKTKLAKIGRESSKSEVHSIWLHLARFECNVTLAVLDLAKSVHTRNVNGEETGGVGGSPAKSNRVLYSMCVCWCVCVYSCGASYASMKARFKGMDYQISENFKLIASNRFCLLTHFNAASHDKLREHTQTQSTEAAMTFSTLAMSAAGQYH